MAHKNTLLNKAVLVLLDAIDPVASGRKRLDPEAVRRWLKWLGIPFVTSSDGEELLLGDGVELVIENETKNAFISSVDLAFALAEYCLNPLFPDEQSQKDYLLFFQNEGQRMQYWMSTFEQREADSD